MVPSDLVTAWMTSLIRLQIQWRAQLVDCIAQTVLSRGATQRRKLFDRSVTCFFCNGQDN